MPIGIRAALQEEIDPLLKELPAHSEVIDNGRRTYHSGQGIRPWRLPARVGSSR
jgi:hypothetical protein